MYLPTRGWPPTCLASPSTLGHTANLPPSPEALLAWDEGTQALPSGFQCCCEASVLLLET